MTHPLKDALRSAYELTKQVRLFTTVGVYEGTLALDPLLTNVFLLNYCSSVDPELAGPKLTLDPEAIKGLQVLSSSHQPRPRNPRP